MRHLVCSVLLLLCTQFSVADSYSLVINNGRVIDPETQLDALRHIGISGNSIAVISEQPLIGEREIDAFGKVVTPGFIDLHTHSGTPLGQYYQAFDGVTTALELEVGAHPVASYGGVIKDQPALNYGASAGYIAMRMQVKNGLMFEPGNSIPQPVNLNGVWSLLKALFMERSEALAATFSEPATPDEIQDIKMMLKQSLHDGAIGIGLPLDYISEAVNKAEIEMIFSVAGQRKAPLFVHIRRGINGDPKGLHEVLDLAKKYDAPLHICHISHNAMRNIELFLAETRKAREEGVDVTVEVLPFNAGSTSIGAAVFGRDWQTIFGISYEDVEWAETGERFNEEMWNEYRRDKPTGGVIHHYLKDEWTQKALAEPGSIVVSDLLPMESKEKHVAPHNSAFTRVLSHYVRDKQVITLPQAIKKMTLLPAQRLEEYAPRFSKKGRLQLGMDADVVIFDEAAVTPQASYRDPYQTAVGLDYVIVAGEPLIDNGSMVGGVLNGQLMTAKP